MEQDLAPVEALRPPRPGRGAAGCRGTSTHGRGHRLSAILATLVAVAALIAVTSGPAADAETVMGATTTSLTAAATVTQGPTGSATTLAATLTDASGSGTPVVSEPIQFAAQKDDGTWAQLGTAVTDASGLAQATLSIPAGTHSYQATFAGDATYQASQSNAVAITGVLAATSMTLSAPTTDPDLPAITLSGAWSYNDPRVTAGGVPNAAVQIYTHGTGSSTWQLSKTLTTGADGRFSWSSKQQASMYYKAVGVASPGTTSAAASAFVKEVPGSTVFTLPKSSPKPTPLPRQPRAVGSGANAVVTTLPSAIWNSMIGVSWHRGCPLGPRVMRLITINYYGFDGYRYRGQLIVHYRGVRDFVGAFTALYNAKIPLHGLYLIDRFGYSSATGGANDYASMQHDNTSAYNCRWVDGNPGVLSPHAYGLSVDINPFENPYKSRLGWTPNLWWSAHKVSPYSWRSYGDRVVAIMRAHGFRWTYGSSDSQHFDAVQGLS